MNWQEALKGFDGLTPVQRAEVMSVACKERGHALQAVCLSCTAEALNRTVNEGVKLAGGINDSALKLMDAGEKWKKKAEQAEREKEVLIAFIQKVADDCPYQLWSTSAKAILAGKVCCEGYGTHGDAHSLNCWTGKGHHENCDVNDPLVKGKPCNCARFR